MSSKKSPSSATFSAETSNRFSRALLCNKFPHIVHQPSPPDAVLKLPASLRRKLVAAMRLR